MIKQSEANTSVFEFLDSSKACLTKRKIFKSVMLSRNSVSVALTYLRKKKRVALFFSGRGSSRRCYWGVVYE